MGPGRALRRAGHEVRRHGVRALLLAGTELTGPAIIEQADTTVFLPEVTTGTVDRWANIVIEVSA